jgi:hypothetical protein
LIVEINKQSFGWVFDICGDGGDELAAGGVGSGRRAFNV